jgi:hypothetical protein
MALILPDVLDLHALTVLVSPHMRDLRRAEQDLRATRGWPALSVNRLVAGTLLGQPPQRWPVTVQDVLAGALALAPEGPVLLADISLLHEPLLALDPLALLRRLAAQHTLVVLWPGSCDGTRLCYATPQHSHYRAWDVQNLHVVAL